MGISLLCNFNNKEEERKNIETTDEYLWQHSQTLELQTPFLGFSGWCQAGWCSLCEPLCSCSSENLWQIAIIFAAHIYNFKHHGLLDMQKLCIDLGFYMLSRNQGFIQHCRHWSNCTSFMNCTFNYKQPVFPLVSNFASCLKPPHQDLGHYQVKDLTTKSSGNESVKLPNLTFYPTPLCLSMSHPACHAQCRWLHPGPSEMP